MSEGHDGRSRRSLLKYLGAMGATAGLAGCNEGGEETPTAEETAAETDTEMETAEPTPEPTATATDTPEPSVSGSVTLVHDTHFHGRFGDPEDPANIGTYFGLMDEIRSENPDALVLGNGDDLASSVLSSVFDGEHMVEAFDAGGLDYDTFGNHDFDMGPETLRTQVENSEFTWVSANATNTATGEVFAAEQGAQRYVIEDVDGVSVGITGLINEEAPNITSMGPDADAEGLVDSLNEVVPEMREDGADVVVALSHVASPVVESQVAPNVDGVDAIVGDHAALVAEEPSVINDTVVSYVGDGFEYVGELQLVVEDGELSDHEFELHETAAAVEEGLEANRDVRSAANSYRNELDEQLEVTIGETETPLDVRESVVRREESNFGNYLSDKIREYADADVALSNGGGIRTDTEYEAGEITKKLVMNILPFPNNVVKLEIDGETLMAALENGVSAVGDLSGRFPQVSGIEYTYDPSAEAGNRIDEATVDGEAVDPEGTYTLATNDFVAGGGDGYEMLTDADRLIDANGGALLSTLVIDKIEAETPIAPEVTGRIEVVDPPWESEDASRVAPVTLD